MKSLINISTTNLEFMEEYIKEHKLTKAALINKLLEELKNKESGQIKEIKLLMTPGACSKAFEYMMMYGIKNLGELVERITPEFLADIREVDCIVKRNSYEYVKQRLKDKMPVECVLEYWINAQK